MRTTMTAALGTALGALALWGLGAAHPASAQSRPTRATQTAAPEAAPAQPAAPAAPDPQEGDDYGGAGYLPGAQFQRKLDGGPGFVCTATNALHTSQCTASCRKGETADCVDAEGSGAPSCGCTKG